MYALQSLPRTQVQRNGNLGPAIGRRGDSYRVIAQIIAAIRQLDPNFLSATAAPVNPQLQ